MLIASSELLESAWIADEVKIFERTGRPIVPISIGHTLGTVDLTGTPFSVLKDRDLVWIDEDPTIGPDDVPSDRAVGLTQGLFKFRRARTYVRGLLAAVAVTLAVLAAIATAAAVRASTQAKLARAAEAEAKRERDEAERQRAEAVAQRRTAEERQRIAQSQALAAEARRSTRQELDSALLTAVAAYRMSPTAEAQTALLEVLARVAHGVKYLHCSGSGFAYAVAFSGDGNQLAYACDHHVTVVDVPAGSVRFTGEVKGEPPRRLAFLDASVLLLGGSSKPRTLDLQTRVQRVLDVTAGLPALNPSTTETDGPVCEQREPVKRYRGPRARSQDGRRFAYVTEENEVVVGVAGGECGDLLGHTHNLFDLAFGGPSGRWLASAGQIGPSRHGIILWDIEQIHPVAVGLVPASAVRFDAKVAIASSGKSWACTGCGKGLVWDGREVEGDSRSDARVTTVGLPGRRDARAWTRRRLDRCL